MDICKIKAMQVVVEIDEYLRPYERRTCDCCRQNTVPDGFKSDQGQVKASGEGLPARFHARRLKPDGSPECKLVASRPNHRYVSVAPQQTGSHVFTFFRCPPRRDGLEQLRHWRVVDCVVQAAYPELGPVPRGVTAYSQDRNRIAGFDVASSPRFSDQLAGQQVAFLLFVFCEISDPVIVLCSRSRTYGFQLLRKERAMQKKWNRQLFCCLH